MMISIIASSIVNFSVETLYSLWKWKCLFSALSFCLYMKKVIFTTFRSINMRHTISLLKFHHNMKSWDWSLQHPLEIPLTWYYHVHAVMSFLGSFITLFGLYPHKDWMKNMNWFDISKYMLTRNFFLTTPFS